jgi:hypothetical protein
MVARLTSTVGLRNQEVASSRLVLVIFDVPAAFTGFKRSKMDNVERRDLLLLF